VKKLTWIGTEKGLGFIPGFPAEDFDCEDEKTAAELVKGGCYEYAKTSSGAAKDAAKAEDEV